MGAPVAPHGAAAAPRPSRRARPERATRSPRTRRADPTVDAARASLAFASLAACAVGLTGADGGLLWIVAGVFTLRSVAATSLGPAWAIACLGAGLRWGTFGLGDLESATRLVGSTLVAGSPVVRIGMFVALAGAVLDEARRPDTRGASWIEQSAAVVAAVALVPSFLVTGPYEFSAAVVPWGVGAAGVLAATIVGRPIARRVSWWVPVALAAAGIVAAEVAL